MNEHLLFIASHCPCWDFSMFDKGDSVPLVIFVLLVIGIISNYYNMLFNA